jgi:hypothetical protein
LEHEQAATYSGRTRYHLSDSDTESDPTETFELGLEGDAEDKEDDVFEDAREHSSDDEEVAPI